MRKLMLVLVAVGASLLIGCRIGEMSQEEKQKVSTLKAEIEKIEKDIAVTEKKAQGATGLIPSIQLARVEADKLTVSIMRQHAVAIESGSRVTISAPAINPDLSLAAELEKEIKETDVELHKTKAESSLYRGGLIKLTIDAKAAMQEFTLSTLKQKYLAAKYGLAVAAVTPAKTTEKVKKQAEIPSDSLGAVSK